MSNQVNSQNNLATDIWISFRALPTWVQVWMLILVSVNFVSLFFLNQPMGGWIAFLAIIAIAPNAIFMLRDRGFGKVMALPHVIPWTILVIILLFFRPQGAAAYDAFLWVLLVVDLISLGFDYTDAWQWFKGHREIPGRNIV